MERPGDPLDPSGCPRPRPYVKVQALDVLADPLDGHGDRCQDEKPGSELLDIGSSSPCVQGCRPRQHAADRCSAPGAGQQVRRRRSAGRLRPPTDDEQHPRRVQAPPLAHRQPAGLGRATRQRRPPRPSGPARARARALGQPKRLVDDGPSSSHSRVGLPAAWTPLLEARRQGRISDKLSMLAWRNSTSSATPPLTLGEHHA